MNLSWWQATTKGETMKKIETMALWQARKTIAAIQTAATADELAEHAGDLALAFAALDNAGMFASLERQPEPQVEITCEWIGRS